MAGSVNGCQDLHIRVLSRRLVKASDSSLKPHVLAVSNLDLLLQYSRVSMVSIYRKPSAGDFQAVVSVFQARLPSLLNHFFPLAGRMATNPSSGVPEVHCNNQGAELVVGKANVSLASLDFRSVTASLRKIQLPCDDAHLALSVQLVSFACGGFAVVWRTNHVLADGSGHSLVVSSFSELARTGTLAATSLPNHDRSMFRPRAVPSYSASIAKEFILLPPLDGKKHQEEEEEVFLERLYCIEASDLNRLREEASGDGGHRATRVQAISAYLWKAHAAANASHRARRCRMAWRVDGRRQLAAAKPPELSAAMRNYVGNVVIMAVRDASAEEIARMPLPDVATLVRDAIAQTSLDGEHFQEVVDWVEEHKTRRFSETAMVGLTCPTLKVAAMSSFRVDTDFGFGHAALGVPVFTLTEKMFSASVLIIARPGQDDGSLFVSASVWPQLAAVLESGEPSPIFKPVTAEYLGLVAPQLQHARL